MRVNDDAMANGKGQDMVWAAIMSRANWWLPGATDEMLRLMAFGTRAMISTTQQALITGKHFQPIKS